VSKDPVTIAIRALRDACVGSRIEQPSPSAGDKVAAMKIAEI
jgi:hypothetical protein